MLYRILRVFFTKSVHILVVFPHPCKASQTVTHAIFSLFSDVGVKWAVFQGFTGTYSQPFHYNRQLKCAAFIHTHTCMLSVSGSEYVGLLEKRYPSKSTDSN